MQIKTMQLWLRRVEWLTDSISLNPHLGQIPFLRSQLATDSTWGRTERIGIIMYGGGGGEGGALS